MIRFMDILQLALLLYLLYSGSEGLDMGAIPRQQHFQLYLYMKQIFPVLMRTTSPLLAKVNRQKEPNRIS